jgi:copper(I)-binding protein
MRRFDWKNIYCASAAGLAVALAQISTTPVQAADYDVGSIHITAPWARATPKGASSGAAYVTIANKGTVPDRVTCMSSDVSGVPNSHHGHGARRDENATCRGRSGNQTR